MTEHRTSSEDSCESDGEVSQTIHRPSSDSRSKTQHHRLSLGNLLSRPSQKHIIDPSFEPKVVRKNNSITRTESTGSLVLESKVLVIYTGGTIGMCKNGKGGKLLTRP